MKHIYFNTTGYSDHILTKNSVDVYDHHYVITDVLGRKHRMPISGTYIFEEDWDGTMHNISNRFNSIVKELQGELTGTATKQK